MRSVFNTKLLRLVRTNPDETSSGRNAGPWHAPLRCLLALLLLLQLSGCGLLAAKVEDPHQPQEQESLEAAWRGDPVPYNLSIKVEDGPSSLEGKMKSVSQLEQLIKEPPDSMLALERRARADVETAVKLLQSQCYYEGTAGFSFDEEAKPIRVTLTLRAGPRYTLGRADISYDPPPDVPGYFKTRERETGFWGLETQALPPPSFPASVPGVTAGEPVVADTLLNAVSALPEQMRTQGYPLAEVSQSRYTLDPEKREVNADIVVKTGPPALMGLVEVKGNQGVNSSYLQRLAPWVPGKEPWDDELMDDYANQLRGLGLFRSVEIRPQEEALAQKNPVTANTAPTKSADGVPVLPLEVTVTELPFRSVGGSARYDTDTGFGVEGFWEHRNLFDNGEKLVVSTPIATQVQGIKAAFEKPAFLVREQRLLVSASALNEDTEAYKSTSASASAAIERRLSRLWWGSIGAGGQSGSIKENDKSEQFYGYIGPKASVRRDSRNNILNPTRGSEITLKANPYSGFYGESFTVMAGSLEASGYYAPFRKDGRPDDKLVLAGRVEAGGMSGAALRNIPGILRYYSGGAGSVRGYPYQSIGPQDKDGDPLGGRSFQEISLEARYKITEDIGLVPFLDGGMVYKDELPHIIGDMDWGVGMGLRYYTPIGPLRLDIATPMQSRDGDPPIQIYVSIGQSF
ncbi:MAG: autotransporter assembly complex protein TamA [Desulfovibrio sp.]|nr:autotransporter assembly complex protein TamA [Desulfovibrio sp.]